MDASPRCDVESFRDRADAGGFESLSIVVAEDVMVSCWASRVWPRRLCGSPESERPTGCVRRPRAGVPGVRQWQRETCAMDPYRGARPLISPRDGDPGR